MPKQKKRTAGTDSQEDKAENEVTRALKRLEQTRQSAPCIDMQCLAGAVVALLKREMRLEHERRGG
jgi:hypothetical protein